MSPEAVLGIAQAAMMVILTIVGPLLLTSLIVGVVIGLVQALTQIQETTLTFVPKLLAMGTVLLLSMPMIGHALGDFTAKLSDAIIHG